MITKEQYLDISVAQFAFRQGFIKELQLYLYLRHEFANSAGWFKMDYKAIANVFGSSERTIHRRIKILINKKLLTPSNHKGKWNGKKFHFSSLNRFKRRLGFTSRAVICISKETILQPLKSFKAFVTAAIVSKNITYRKKYKRFLDPELKTNGLKLYSNYSATGYMSTSIIAQHLGKSQGTAFNYLALAKEKGFISSKKTFMRLEEFPDLRLLGQSCFPVAQKANFIKKLTHYGYFQGNNEGKPDLVSRVQIIELSGKKTGRFVCGVRWCDLLMSHMTLKRRSNQWKHYYEATGESLDFIHSEDSINTFDKVKAKGQSEIKKHFGNFGFCSNSSTNKEDIRMFP